MKTRAYQTSVAILLIGVVCVTLGFSLWDGLFSRSKKEQAAPKTLENKSTAQQAVEQKSPMKALRTALTRLSSNDAARAGLSMRDAEYWTLRPDGDIRCQLCPNKCIIPNGYRGLCRARVNIDGVLKTLVYGRVVAANIDPIEKKPLFHFHPDTRSFSIATAGCNMNCLFCQNWQISQATPESTRYMKFSPADGVNAAVENKCLSIAYTYTEPTIYFEYMRDTAKLAHEKGIKNVWVTCGYIQEKPLRELCKYIDAANVDLKGFSDIFYEVYTTGELEPVLETFKILKEEGVWTELTNLIIPGANDDPVMISNMCAWIVKELGPDVPVHFSRFHPDFKLRDRPATPVATIEKAVAIAKHYGIHFVYAGNIAGNTYESTVCPGCGKILIKRYGYLIQDIHIKDGKCEYCGRVIPGRW